MRLAPNENVDYIATPTISNFHRSNALVRGIMGPIGSGKSVGCTLEMFIRCNRQVEYKGWKRSRWAVIRNTYPELETTTIKTVQEWFPPSIFNVKFSHPICGKLYSKKYGIDAEIYFLALDRPEDIKKLLSLELTGIWVNEARQIPRSVLDMALGRTGRYPPKKWGGFNWRGLIMDTNPPDDDHWWYSMAEEEELEGYEFFQQPPAVFEVETGSGRYEPNYGQGAYPPAENVENHTLGFDYWMSQIPGKTREWIRVYLEGRYGTVQHGKPVYPEYNDLVHGSRTALVPVQGLPLIVGWDFGRTPAIVVNQLLPSGQLRTLDELYTENMGARQFGRDKVKPYLANNFSGYEVFHTGDPSGNRKSEADEIWAIQILKDKVGINVTPAKTNMITPRTDAVKSYLTKLAAGGGPGYLLSSKCKRLKKGFLGGYCFARVQVSGGEEIYRDEPKKNIYSHVHDAQQYAAMFAETSGGASLVSGGGYEVPDEYFDYRAGVAGY